MTEGHAFILSIPSHAKNIFKNVWAPSKGIRRRVSTDVLIVFIFDSS